MGVITIWQQLLIIFSFQNQFKIPIFQGYKNCINQMGLREPAGSFRILLQNSPTF